MKKYKLTITHSYIVALGKWLEDELSSEQNTSFEQIAIWVLLYKWQNSEAIRNYRNFPFSGEKKISLKSEYAAALASAIENTSIENTSYLGNYLRIIYGEIHQFFNLKM